MTRLYTLLIFLTACGSTEDGAVSLPTASPEVTTEAPSEPKGQTGFVPVPTPSPTTAVVAEETEEIIATPTISPTPTPDPVNHELMAEKKELFDSRFETRIDNLLTWDIGQDWEEKDDHLDYTFVAMKDYLPAELGALTSNEENETWMKDVFQSNGHGPQFICGEVDWTDVTYSELTIVWADDSVSHIRIEIAFYENMTIKYISLDLQKSTDETEQGWVNQTCN
jgi:hypothetical protein